MRKFVRFNIVAAHGSDPYLIYDVGSDWGTINLDANGNGRKQFEAGQVLAINPRANGTAYDTVTVKMTGALLHDEPTKKDKTTFSFRTDGNAIGGKARTIRVDE